MLKTNDIEVIINGVIILRNITIELHAGDFVVIVGPNGAGKSTFMNIITGFVVPTNGSLLLDNEDITQWDVLKRAHVINMVHQNPTRGTVADMTVQENLALACLKGVRAGFANGMRILTDFLNNNPQLHMLINANLLDKKMSQLSGGQRQLIAFIMATIYPTSLLLLDEPTAALDPKSADHMITVIEQYAQEHNTITILITHTIDDALRLGNKLWIMKGGQMVTMLDKQEKEKLTGEIVKQLISS